jgi:beta-lactamase superfamily II metal-dependent hydrolase
MLDIKIFDVDRGFCAVVHTGDRTAPLRDRHQILIDCGYNSRSGFNSTRYLLDNSTRRLNYSILSTFSKGCLAGLYNLIGHSFNNCFSIERLLVNPSINAESLPELIVRNFGTSNSLKFLSDVCKRCGNMERIVHLGEVEISFFWNSYPEFLDFHNLSLVTFVSYKNISIIFPGNLKTEGWHTLLRNSRFRDRLARVNLFVASKHGRTDGYCSDVFNYCTPELIIISNRDRLATTVVSQYERHMD